MSHFKHAVAVLWCRMRYGRGGCPHISGIGDRMLDRW